MAAGRPATPVKSRPSDFCEMCFWRCGGIAYVRDGKLWKFEGNPIDRKPRQALPARHRAVGSVTILTGCARH